VVLTKTIATLGAIVVNVKRVNKREEGLSLSLYEGLRVGFCVSKDEDEKKETSCKEKDDLYIF
jgi:hypothetical protein